MKAFKNILKAGIISAAFVVLAAFSAEARDYTVAASTHIPTASATDFSNGNYPNISGGAVLRTLVLSNAGATAQTVTVYDTCTSSTTATVALKVDLPAAVGAVAVPANGPWLPTIFRVANPCVTKSSASSAVQATFFYE